MSRYIDADALTWLVEEYKLAISPITEEQERDNRLPLQMLTEFENIIAEQPTVDAVPVDFIKALHTDYVQRSKALQGRTAYMYTLYAIALENLMQSFDYDNEIADIMRVERNCADGERKDDGNI
jgi:hypothetical protein